MATAPASISPSANTATGAAAGDVLERLGEPGAGEPLDARSVVREQRRAGDQRPDPEYRGQNRADRGVVAAVLDVSGSHALVGADALCWKKIIHGVTVAPIVEASSSSSVLKLPPGNGREGQASRRALRRRA